MSARHRRAVLVLLIVVVGPVAGTTPPAGAVTSQAAADATESLSLTARSGPDATWSRLDDPAAIRAAIDEGRLPARDRVFTADVLVIGVHSARLTEHLAGENATDRFFDLLARPAQNLSVAQTNPAPQRQRLVLNLSPADTRVVSAPAANVTYLVIDTAAVRVHPDGDPDEQVDRWRLDGAEFRFALELRPDSPLSDAAEPVTATRTVTLDRRTARVQTDTPLRDRLYRLPAANQTITGVTNLPANRTVTVILRGVDDPTTAANESFLRRQRVRLRPAAGTADEPRTRFTATFDLSDVPDPTNATVAVRFDGQPLLGERPTMLIASPRADLAVTGIQPNATGRYTRVTVTVNVSRGGFVVLHRDAPTGAVVGVSTYLPPGFNGTAVVYVGRPVDAAGRLVAVAHRDANHNELFDNASVDTRYGEADAVAHTNYTVTPAATATPTTVSPSSPTAPAGSTTTAPPTTPTSPTTTTVPGFGAGVALVILLLVGLEARRRTR